MKWLINKALLTPSVEQLLGRQIDSWTSKTIATDPLKLKTFTVKRTVELHRDNKIEIETLRNLWQPQKEWKI